MRRYFDEYRGLRETIGHVEGFGVRSSARIVRDSGRRRPRAGCASGACRAPSAGAGRSARPSTTAGARVFSALGSRADRLPAPVQRAVSLEGKAVAALQRASRARAPTVAGARARPARSTRTIRARRGRRPGAAAGPGARDVRAHAAARRGRDPAVPARLRRAQLDLPDALRGSSASGTRVSIWLHDPMGWQRDEWPAVVRGNIREYFAPLEAPGVHGFDHWYGADVAVATGWQTVHPVLLLGDVPRARLPGPRPRERVLRHLRRELVGRADVLASGCTRSPPARGCADLMADRYGTPASQFDFGVDHDDLPPARRSTRRRDTIIFYGRDVTPRRAVPLGLLALQELHRRRPSVRIVMFGDLEPHARAVPLRAPRHRLAGAARVGLLGGDRRPRAVDDQLLADPAGDARLRAAVRRPRRLQRRDRVRRRRAGRARALRPRRDRRRARAAARRRGAVAAPLGRRAARSSPTARGTARPSSSRPGCAPRCASASRARHRRRRARRRRGVATPPARGVVSRAVPVEIFGARPTTERLLAQLDARGHRRGRGRAGRGHRAVVRDRRPGEPRRADAGARGLAPRPGRAREDRPAARPAARARARDGPRPARRPAAASTRPT